MGHVQLPNEDLLYLQALAILSSFRLLHDNADVLLPCSLVAYGLVIYFFLVVFFPPLLAQGHFTASSVFLLMSGFDAISPDKD